MKPEGPEANFPSGFIEEEVQKLSAGAGATAKDPLSALLNNPNLSSEDRDLISKMTPGRLSQEDIATLTSLTLKYTSL
jgi:hypothetical protein